MRGAFKRKTDPGVRSMIRVPKQAPTCVVTIRPAQLNQPMAVGTKSQMGHLRQKWDLLQIWGPQEAMMMMMIINKMMKDRVEEQWKC